MTTARLQKSDNKTGGNEVRSLVRLLQVCYLDVGKKKTANYFNHLKLQETCLLAQTRKHKSKLRVIVSLWTLRDVALFCLPNKND